MPFIVDMVERMKPIYIKKNKKKKTQQNIKKNKSKNFANETSLIVSIKCWVKN